MTELVLDASVVLHWFQGGRDPAHRLRSEYQDGRLAVVVPPLLYLEIINVAGRRWGWDGAALVRLAGALAQLGFDNTEPPLEAVAEWTGHGLTAYDSAYVALAESLGLPLITLDDHVLRVAPDVARRPGE